MPIKSSEEISSSNQNPKITWEGCSVLLDINDGDRMLFARLTAGSVIKIGNKNYSLQPLIGCRFGSTFQVEVGEDGPFLSRVVSSVEVNNDEEKTDCKIMEECRDNRMLVDNNTAQSLTGEDIDGMRRKGATGDEIIEALIANSATFEKKTAFSQEKYRIKKQKKYSPRVLVRRPFARSICEAYFQKHAEKIGFLRVDTLSLMLSLANVTANSDVLLLDMLDGLVTGAVAERLGGTGYVCNTFCGSTPHPISIVRMFNLSDETRKRIVHASLAELKPARSDTSANIDQIEDDSNIEKHENKEDPMGEDNNVNMESIDTVNKAAASIKPNKSIKAMNKAPLCAINYWKENGFSSLIVAAPDRDAWGIVKELVPLLSYSAPFVIYHQFLQPLASCMHNLQIEKMAIGLRISEPWLREYQLHHLQLTEQTVCGPVAEASWLAACGEHLEAELQQRTTNRWTTTLVAELDEQALAARAERQVAWEHTLVVVVAIELRHASRRLRKEPAKPQRHEITPP